MQQRGGPYGQELPCRKQGRSSQVTSALPSFSLAENLVRPKAEITLLLGQLQHDQTLFSATLETVS